MSMSLRALARRVAQTQYEGIPSEEEAGRLLASCREGLNAVMAAHWEGRVTDKAAHDSSALYERSLVRVCSELRGCEDQLWDMAGSFARSERRPETKERTWL